MECQTKRLVHLLAALSTVEQVLLDILPNREERAADLVRSCIDAVRASYPSGDSACKYVASA